MPTLGSSSAPSWAGWDWPGAGFAFAAKYTVPAGNDILVTKIHAFFSSNSGTPGATAYCAVWDSNTADVIVYASAGLAGNGSNAAGGQSWHTVSVSHVIAAGTQIWIGGYTDGNMIFSTYDTSPQTYVVNMGNTGIGRLTPGSNSGQGPCGGYIEYSTILKASTDTLGQRSTLAGGLTASAKTLVPASVADLGEKGGGIPAVNAQLLINSTDLMGGAGGLSCFPVLNVPGIRIWRP